MWRSVKILSIFSTLTLKQSSLNRVTLVEGTKVEKASFPYKTAMSQTNVKTNRMVTTKWVYQRERIFASNYFIFLKAFFLFKDLSQIIDLMCQQPKRPYSYFL